MNYCSCYSINWGPHICAVLNDSQILAMQAVHKSIVPSMVCEHPNQSLNPGSKIMFFPLLNPVNNPKDFTLQKNLTKCEVGAA